ncbi:MAG: hypothetical protein JWQ43_2376 [Glaciihabitans sp.]|nr:hypothetical protein [Glaciihabitans sp.]
MNTEIGRVATVFVPVSDHEQALEFYLDILGFEKRADYEYSAGIRWIEVAPHGSENTLSLVPGAEGIARRSDHAHCALTTNDIDTDHARLLQRGVEVDNIVAGEGSSRSGLVSLEVDVANPIPRQFFFRDPDGNRFLLVDAS